MFLTTNDAHKFIRLTKFLKNGIEPLLSMAFSSQALNRLSSLIAVRHATAAIRQDIFGCRAKGQYLCTINRNKKDKTVVNFTELND